MKTHVDLGENGYDIIIQRGALREFAALTGVSGKALIVTDDGVPEQYPLAVASQLPNAFIYTVEQGENGKSLRSFEALLTFMLQKGFTRKDCVIACGGGVPGDLAGFTAACYMRGVDFYNIPTTVLSQVDSSVGGKTAVNLNGIKNAVGAFKQPKAVIIDPDVLSTLPQRQIANGLAEAVKMSLTSDEELFGLFEREDAAGAIDEIIFRSVEIKRKVVEADEKETGLRMLLNFGHTVGHGIESTQLSGGLYHGECVALGMLTMCSEPVRKRLTAVLGRLGLKTKTDFDPELVLAAICHDKKSDGNLIRTVFTEAPGSYEFRQLTPEEIGKTLGVIRE